MSNSALQINLNIATSIETGSNVLFDSIEYLSGNIGYDTATGTVLIAEPGRYIIHWWLATQSSSCLNGASFAISSSQGDLIIGTSPVKTGEVYGIGIIEATSAPVTFSLMNISTSSVFFSQHIPLRGTLVVDQDETNEVIGPTGPTGPAGVKTGLKKFIEANHAENTFRFYILCVTDSRV